MDDATQKLVDRLREVQKWGSTHELRATARKAADALEAAQRESSGLREKLEISMAVGAKDAAERDALKAAQRPPVSPEVREEMEWAGIKALVESAEVPTGVRGLLLGEVFTIREAVDAEVVVQVILDAILARFSFPQHPPVSPEVREEAWNEFRDGPDYQPTDRYEVRPVFDAGWDAAARFSFPTLDVEKVAAELRRISAEGDEPTDAWADRWATALVAALQSGELTREETNE